MGRVICYNDICSCTPPYHLTRLVHITSAILNGVLPENLRDQTSSRYTFEIPLGYSEPHLALNDRHKQMRTNTLLRGSASQFTKTIQDLTTSSEVVFQRLCTLAARHLQDQHMLIGTLHLSITWYLFCPSLRQILFFDA